MVKDFDQKIDRISRLYDKISEYIGQSNAHQHWAFPTSR